MAVKKKKQSNLGAPTKILNSIGGLVKMLNPIVKESSKIAETSSKGMMKVAADMKSPLDGAVSLFSSINDNIKKVATSVSETTGISKVMAAIMGDDLKLTKKQQTEKARTDALTKAKKDGPIGPVKSNFADDLLSTLKDSFKNLIPKESIGDLTKILLIATGAALLIKFAGKFQKVLAPVLEFLFETLIPGFKELFATIMKSPTGFLGIGGVVMLATTAVSRYGTGVKTFFTDIGKSMSKGLKAFKAMMLPPGYFTRITGPISKITTFISNLAKTIGSGAKTIFKLIPMVSKFASFGKLFIRFLGPVGLVIQAFVGLFSGITRAVATFKAGGSIFAVIGSFFSGIFDALIGSVVNLLADLLGFIVKKLGFEKLGEFISNLDFTTEGIGKGIAFVVDKIKNAFVSLVDGLKFVVNGIIKKINSFRDKIGLKPLKLLETSSMKEDRLKEEKEGIKGSEGTNIAEGLADKESSLNANARAEGNAKRLEKVTGTTVTAVDDTTTEKFDFKQEKAKVLKAETEKLATQKAQTRTLGNINAINNSKGATTVNQTSVHSNGEPASDHNDMTAKHLTAAFAV